MFGGVIGWGASYDDTDKFGLCFVYKKQHKSRLNVSDLLFSQQGGSRLRLGRVRDREATSATLIQKGTEKEITLDSSK